MPAAAGASSAARRRKRAQLTKAQQLLGESRVALYHGDTRSVRSRNSCVRSSRSRRHSQLFANDLTASFQNDRLCVNSLQHNRGSEIEGQRLKKAQTRNQIREASKKLRRQIIGKLINDDRVQSIVLLLIGVNAIMMGIATFPFVKENPDLSAKFDFADQVFLILFTVESGMQLMFHGHRLFLDGFLAFDLAIVVLSWALQGAQVFSAFRIFRALRVITRVQVMKNLVLALFSVLPKMSAIMMLLALIMYIFAVMFTQLFKGMYAEGLVEQPYFESLDQTLFTLFQMMTLDTWSKIERQIAEVYPWVWAPFLIYIAITSFVVVNLMIAVICDAVQVMSEQEQVNAVLEKSEEEEKTEKEEEETEEESSDIIEMSAARMKQLEQQVAELFEAQEKMKTIIEAMALKFQGTASNDRSSVALAETTNGMSNI